MASPRVRRLRRAARLSKTTPAPAPTAPVAAAPVVKEKLKAAPKKAKRVSAKKSD